MKDPQQPGTRERRQGGDIRVKGTPTTCQEPQAFGGGCRFCICVYRWGNIVTIYAFNPGLSDSKTVPSNLTSLCPQRDFEERDVVSWHGQLQQGHLGPRGRPGALIQVSTPEAPLLGLLLSWSPSVSPKPPRKSSFWIHCWEQPGLMGKAKKEISLLCAQESGAVEQVP